MISQISGNVEHVAENTITVQTSGLSYEVYIPTAVMKNFDGKISKGAQVSLITYHYYQTDPSKSIPILIGFANRVEKDFFEKFITVSGVGPKAAVRALSQPIGDIAEAIDSADLAFLKSLPGIGEQRAKEIIAKLQGKMGKFALMRRDAGDSNAGPDSVGAHGRAPQQRDAQEEALEILLQLQYKKDEAKEIIRKAFSRNPKLSTSEEILNEVYRQSKEQAKVSLRGA